MGSSTAKAKTKKTPRVAPEIEINYEEGAEALIEALGLSADTLVGRLKTTIAEGMGVSRKKITDEIVGETLATLHAGGKLDVVLRNVGLVPRPNWFSALSGWHNVEHLRARGASNKIAGIVSLGYQATAIALTAYLGLDWYQSRPA